VTGAGFRGISGASGGDSSLDSPADYPLVQLRSIESGQTLFLLTTNWSTNSFISTPVHDFPIGWTLATVFVNGIPSTSSVLRIAPGPTAIVLFDPVKQPGGGVQVGFTNTPGAVFTALATTNLSLLSSNWTVLGSATEISDGHFQFTDSQATNYPRRFYHVRSP
jgi:hypothetical protein